MKILLKNLKNLRQLEPRLEWAMRTKSFLMSKIEEKETGNFVERFHIFILRLERKLIPSPVKIIATLLVLSLASGTTLAAKAAIPGNPLYPVKTQIEKVELVLATTPKAEAVVHLNHAKNRIFEVEQLNKKDPMIMADQINNTVKNLKKDITASQNSLEIAEKDENNVEAVVAVAVQLNQGAVQASQVLNQTVTNVSSEEIKQTVSEAVETTEAVQDNTTSLIVDKKVNGLVSDRTVTTDQVKEIVVNNINTIENKIKSVEEKVNQIESVKVNEAINQQEGIVDTDLKKEDVVEIINKKEEARQVLEEAKKLVNETALSEALVKAKESKEIAQETQRVLNKIDKVIQEASNQNQTSGTEIDNKLIPGQIYSTTTASSTVLEVSPIIELGGINNEEEPVIDKPAGSEPLIETTPPTTN